jgi:FKBP-type peptidyl-prolyl cis-trans isomerase
MRKGELAKVTVPPKLAYGKTGGGVIPPHATLVFEMEIVDMREADANWVV